MSQETNPLTLSSLPNPTTLLPLLHSTPALARTRDANGYTLIHALTSYNHLSLLSQIVSEFQLDPSVRDADGETALFFAETVAAARLLVEELGVDPGVRNSDGETAEEKIRLEGEFGGVSDYLREVRLRGGAGGGASAPTPTPAPAPGGDGNGNGEDANEDGAEASARPPPLPKGMTLNLATVDEGAVEAAGEPDAAFRRRIEELAASEDFNGEEGQRALRELVADAVRDVGASANAGGRGGGGREVRRRVE